ncbi:MAG: class I SAM-dependent methyltransferase [Planctomycetales bacterium]|nr:class I SAM-dependent methyltransferase [Planctomycetales bacterium]
MDDPLEVQEYRRMDHSHVNQQFVVDLIAGGAVGPRVVDLGCGTAEIPVLLCQKLIEVEVLGVDSSVEMLEAARVEIELGGVVGRIYLEHADCKELAGFEPQTANTVISNTVLHHIAQPESLLTQAVRILAPGGRLFIRDLVRPATESDVERLVTMHADGESEFAQQLLRQSLHAALTLEEMNEMMQDLGIPPKSIQMTSDRHWTLDWKRGEV